jgi:hypothetical protein
MLRNLLNGAVSFLKMIFLFLFYSYVKVLYFIRDLIFLEYSYLFLEAHI